MAAETALVAWAALRLDTAGVALWRESGTYPPRSARPVVVATAVPDKPDNLITLTAYPLDDDADTRESLTGLQVRVRTGGRDPRATDRLAEAVWAHLPTLTPAPLPGGVRVHDLVRVSGATLGQDPAGRWERADTYRARVHVPGTPREGSETP